MKPQWQRFVTFVRLRRLEILLLRPTYLYLLTITPFLSPGTDFTDSSEHIQFLVFSFFFPLLVFILWFRAVK